MKLIFLPKTSTGTAAVCFTLSIMFNAVCAQHASP